MLLCTSLSYVDDGCEKNLLGPPGQEDYTPTYLYNDLFNDLFTRNETVPLTASSFGEKAIRSVAETTSLLTVPVRFPPLPGWRNGLQLAFSVRRNSNDDIRRE